MMENIKRITFNDFCKMQMIARQAVEHIPYGHCRIKEEQYNKELAKLFDSAKPRTDGKINYIVVTESYNQGTARYPHNIRIVNMYSVGKYAKETEKTFAGFRKSNILALVK